MYILFILYFPQNNQVSLGISVLLSYSVFLLMVSELMPRTSDVNPVISKSD